MGGKQVQWSKEDDERLLKRCAELTTLGVNGLPCVRKEGWGQLTTEFPGRGATALKHRQRELKARAGIRREYRPRINTKPKAVIGIPRQKPVLLPSPISITAFVFGDPLPGRSALDKKHGTQSSTRYPL